MRPAIAGRGGRGDPAPLAPSSPGRGEPRWYRQWASGSPPAQAASTFTVREGETDLWVACRPDLDGPRAASACARRVRDVRASILVYAAGHGDFLMSMRPLPADSEAPPVVCAMLEAGLRASVGPMAAVAGAIAEDTAVFLRNAFGCESVVVENGGDIFAFSPTPLEVAVLAGNSPLSGKLTLRTLPAGDGIGICTSSGTVGPSRSLGRADAATVLAAEGALADALATALGNRIRSGKDIGPALAWLAGVGGAIGGLAVCGEHVGAWGQVEILPEAPAEEP